MSSKIKTYSIVSAVAQPKLGNAFELVFKDPQKYGNIFHPFP